MKNNKLISKTEQEFRSEKHNIFSQEINNIALRSNDDKRIKSIDSVGTYAYETSKDLICKKEKNKCDNITKQCKKRLTLIILQKEILKNMI